jgi:hypothetical protein
MKFKVPPTFIWYLHGELHAEIMGYHFFLTEESAAFCKGANSENKINAVTLLCHHSGDIEMVKESWWFSGWLSKGLEPGVFTYEISTALITESTCTVGT